MPVSEVDGLLEGIISVVRVFDWVDILLNVVQVTSTFHVHRRILTKAQ